jgi:hypothetical protein
VRTAEALRGLHSLVNNADIFQPYTLMETDPELFERQCVSTSLTAFSA